MKQAAVNLLLGAQIISVPEFQMPVEDEPAASELNVEVSMNGGPQNGTQSRMILVLIGTTQKGPPFV